MKPGAWWDRTANWQTGCSKCSPGCAHCWALSMTRRMVRNPRAPRMYTDCAIGPLRDGEWSGDMVWSRTAMTKAFEDIHHTKKPLVWFLGGMTDLFHENTSTGMWATMASRLEYETKQLLVFVTKRPQGLLDFQRAFFPQGLPRWVFAFLTVCNQSEADEKIPMFLQVKGRLGLHLEPLLGAVDLDMPRCETHDREFIYVDTDGQEWCSECHANGWTGELSLGHWLDGCAEKNGHRIGFVAAGAESGPGARPVDPDWLRAIRDQCFLAGVPFFLKRPLTLDGATHAPRLEMP